MGIEGMNVRLFCMMLMNSPLHVEVQQMQITLAATEIFCGWRCIFLDVINVAFHFIIPPQIDTELQRGFRA